MKILILNWRDIKSPEAGGAEVHLHEIATRLVKFGHEVTLIVSRFASKTCSTEETVDGIRILRVGSWWNAHITIPKAARRLFLTEQFDVVLDDVNKIPFFAPKWSPIPVVALFHHLLGETVFLETNWFCAKAISILEDRIGQVYKNAQVVTVSRSTEEELSLRGIPSTSIEIVENGLNHETYHPGHDAKSDHSLIVVTSRLKPYKKVDVAIRAFAGIKAQIPDAELVVIGEGSDRARLSAIAQSLNLPVTFTGAASESAKVSWLRRAHLTLLPSMKEGFGLVAIESMACGTPVVATDVPGHRDSVCEGTGTLVPEGGAIQMAEAALRYLQDQDLYDSAQAQGLCWVRRFDWERAATGLEGALKRAAGFSMPGLREEVFAGGVP